MGVHWFLTSLHSNSESQLEYKLRSWLSLFSFTTSMAWDGVDSNTVDIQRADVGSYRSTCTISNFSQSMTHKVFSSPIHKPDTNNKHTLYIPCGTWRRHSMSTPYAFALYDVFYKPFLTTDISLSAHLLWRHRTLHPTYKMIGEEPVHNTPSPTSNYSKIKATFARPQARMNYPRYDITNIYIYSIQTPSIQELLPILSGLQINSIPFKRKGLYGQVPQPGIHTGRVQAHLVWCN